MTKMWRFFCDRFLFEEKHEKWPQFQNYYLIPVPVPCFRHLAVKLLNFHKPIYFSTQSRHQNAVSTSATAPESELQTGSTPTHRNGCQYLTYICRYRCTVYNYYLLKPYRIQLYKE